MITDTIDRLFLELSQVTAANTQKELRFMTKVEELETRNRKLEKKIMQVEELREYYKSIGFNDTAKRIDEALKGEGPK